MAETKTKATDASVDAFLDGVEHLVRRADGQAVRTMMERVTGEPAMMWGPSIVGFGSYHHRYASGHESDSAASASRGARPISCSTSAASPNMKRY